PASDQPTEAYPPASDEPAAPATPASGADGYPLAPPTGPAYAAPTAPSAPVAGATDTRPKRLAWIALGLAVAGLVLVLIAFIPLLWVSFALAVVGGILLLAGLIVGIMVLAKKNQGGKGLGIGAIVVSVLGGAAWVGAIVLSLVLIGLASGGGSMGTDEPTAAPSASVEESATPAPSSEASGEATEAPDETATGVYDEAAYLAEVRPTLTALFTEIDPTITDEVATMVFPDESLVQIGQAVISGDLNREALVSTLVSEDGIFTQEQAERFYDTIDAAAQKHLVQ
ncbi:hypothetical protein QL996_06915, partial [Planococcus sp. APC 4015]|nr:hypothetical protein [Planococcus sp. APC 4015]